VHTIKKQAQLYYVCTTDTFDKRFMNILRYVIYDPFFSFTITSQPSIQTSYLSVGRSFILLM